MRDTFSTYHPIVNFCYFALVLGFSMAFSHPACLISSIACGVVYACCINGRNSLGVCIKIALPAMLVAALVNPAFNHAGETMLAYLPNGNPLTLESIAYGFAAGGMICSAILWFTCYSAVMTSDKFVYLFGRVIPALSLVLSMTLRFVPKFRTQLETVSEAQRSLGRDVSEGSVLSRVKSAVTVMSVMITWALENAIETADSMKARGYGLKGRTAFSIFRFDARDKSALLWLCFLTVFILCGAVAGAFSWRYFPNIRGAVPTASTVGFHIAFLALYITPVTINIAEDRKWKYLQSKI